MKFFNFKTFKPFSKYFKAILFKQDLTVKFSTLNLRHWSLKIEGIFMEGLTIKTIPFTIEEIDKIKTDYNVFNDYPIIYISYIRRKKLILVKQ